MKAVVVFAVGLVLGSLIGFSVRHKAVSSETKRDAVIVENYGYYTRCVARIPRHRLLPAKTVPETIAAQNRAFYLLAAMYDCGSTSGIGGRRLLELSPYSGFMPASPLALKLFPPPTP
jgi:hypothetical protein